MIDFLLRILVFLSFPYVFLSIDQGFIVFLYKMVYLCIYRDVISVAHISKYTYRCCIVAWSCNLNIFKERFDNSSNSFCVDSFFTIFLCNMQKVSGACLAYYGYVFF